VLFRLLLFKLYWESGLAKWQSGIGDWQNGSAMELYYQTAPLPTWVAWYAHHLPLGWHHLESWSVLVLELVLPFGIFGPRPVRLALFGIFTGFQALNIATANYGFFSYLAMALHVFLLDDRDVVRLATRLPRWPRRRAAPMRSAVPPWRRVVRLATAVVISTAFVAVSTVDALWVFADLPTGVRRAIAPLQAITAPWRLINTYHLFGQITRERIEPEFQAEVDGQWRELDLRYKPGDPNRPPPFVAPHQPRVDFQLWFYGLSFQGGMPTYVATLLGRLCHDPAAVQSLFAAPLPARPEAVRIVFWDYRFSSPGDTAWWRREAVAETQPLNCRQQFKTAPTGGAG